MAVSATSQKLEFGARNIAFQLTGLGDGQGQETLVPKVIASQFLPLSKSPRLERISGVTDYGVVELFWDALVPVRFMVLSGQFNLDYCRIGGLINPQPPGFTGNILLSTLGFELNSTYTILLELVK